MKIAEERFFIQGFLSIQGLKQARKTVYAKV